MSAVPAPYTRQFSFTTFAANNPGQPPPAVQLDAEFNAVKVTTDQVESRLAEIQRDDGALFNEVVKIDSLAPEVLALFSTIGGSVLGPWVTGTSYQPKDIVSFSGGTYIAALEHAAGDFAVDLAAGDWVALFSPTKTVATAANIAALVSDFIGQLAIEQDTSEIWISYGTNAGEWELLNQGLVYVNDAFIIVKTSPSPTSNGTALLAAYALAKTLTPNGAALSATNRARVVLPPGTYDLGSSSLVINANWVDIIGQTTDRLAQKIVSTTATTNSGVLYQAGDYDVRFENFSLKNNCGPSGTYNSTGSADYFCGNAFSGTRMKNIEFLSNIGGSESPYPTRIGVSYNGLYENCQALGEGLFGGSPLAAVSGGGNAAGRFYGCTGGDYAFGGSIGNTVSGICINCTGARYSFGGYFGTISSSALIVNCRLSDGNDTFFDFGLVPAAGARLINCVDVSGSVFFPTPPLTAGTVVQKVYAETADSTKYTTVIPVDNTVPLWNEGTLFLQATITPRFASSKILVKFQGYGAGSLYAVSLFRNGTNPTDGAIAAAATQPYNNNFQTPIALAFLDSPATTGATVYSVRIGGNPIQMNGRVSLQCFGGVSKATLIIEEIKT